MRLPPGVALARGSHEADRAPGPTASHRVLELRVPAVPEPGAHSEKVLSSGRTFDRRAQTEEGMMLDCALPQMLTRLLVPEPKIKSVSNHVVIRLKLY